MKHTLPCPVCGKIRSYSSSSGFYKAKKENKSCKSCSNSMIAGGFGIVLYNDKGEKCCIDCKQYKPSNEYYNNKSGKTSICKICSHIRSKTYNKEIGRYKKYGITKDTFIQLIDSQDGKCAICSNSLDNEIHIDHCHTTGKVRGILCGKCNKGLGLFDDNVNYLIKAIKYLNK